MSDEKVDANVLIHPTAEYMPYATTLRLLDMVKTGNVIGYVVMAKVMTPNGPATMPMACGDLTVGHMAEFSLAMQNMAAQYMQSAFGHSKLGGPDNEPPTPDPA